MSLSAKETYEFLFKAFPDVLSVSQLSRMLNINEKTAYQLVRENQINHFKVGRVYKIPKIAVLNYINHIAAIVDSQTCHN